MQQSYRIPNLFLLIVLLSAFGCSQQIPREALELTPESLSHRRLQTRRFETRDEETLLAAGVGVLQDLGFTVESSETRLGVIIGSKKQSAYNPAEIALSAALTILSFYAGAPAVMPVNKKQEVRASLVVRSADSDGKSSRVRVTFQRTVWNTEGEVTRSELLKDPKVYQAFFGKISKAIFLEAHEL